MTITKKNSKIKKNSKTKKNSLRKKLNISGGALPIYGNIQKSICTLLEEYKKYEKNENPTYVNIKDYSLYSKPNINQSLGYKHGNIFFNIHGPGPEPIYSVVENSNFNSKYKKNPIYGNFEDYPLYSEPNKYPNLGPKHRNFRLGPKRESIYSVFNNSNSNSNYDLYIPDKMQTKINNGNHEVAIKFYELINIMAERTLLNMVYKIIPQITKKNYNIANLSNEQIKNDIYSNHYKAEQQFLEDNIFDNETHNELILTYVKKYIEYIIKFIKDNNLERTQIFIPDVEISKPPQDRSSAPVSAPPSPSPSPSLSETAPVSVSATVSNQKPASAPVKKRGFFGKLFKSKKPNNSGNSNV
jgi:hypothetical protein